MTNVPAARHRQVHDRAHVVRRNEDLRLKVRFLYALDLAEASGMSCGEWSETISPSLLEHVVFHRRRRRQQDRGPNSRSRRSLMTSMWSKPKKSHAEPEPERVRRFSGSQISAGSLSESFSSASFSGSYWSPSIGNRPVIDHRLHLAVPRKRFAARRPTPFVIVSPTFTCAGRP